MMSDENYNSILECISDLQESYNFKYSIIKPKNDTSRYLKLRKHDKTYFVNLDQYNMTECVSDVASFVTSPDGVFQMKEEFAFFHTS